VPVLSRPVALAGDADRAPTGYALVFPLYADGQLPDDVASRRARLRGYTMASFVAGEFFAAVLGDGELQAPIALRVRDGDGPDAVVHADVNERAWREATLVTSRAIAVSGRRWTLEAAGRPSLVAFDELLLPPVVAAGGIVLSLLLFGLLRTLARARATAETTIDALKRGDDARAALLAIERRARQEAQQLVAALERSNRELDQFAYVASHDLKSPLRGIANLSSWIEEDLADAATPETKKNLELLRGRVRRLENLIDGILSYSRAGRGGEPEEVDVGALVREVVGLLALPAEAALVVGPLPTLHTERTPLQQVFMNLVANAIKYAGKPDVRITIDGRETATGWEFTVGDDGPGIAAEYHDKVWQMFQTLHARDQVEATGIGLAVVKKIVESRGGAVQLDSASGTGARVTFGWPARPPTPASAPRPPAASA
jgi:signal transduction histidine kinase